jgi:hypothetical protein
MKLASFKEVVSALNGAEVRYLVAGGLAVAAHGYGRLTYDVDLVISLESDNVLKAFRALEGLGYQPRVPVTGEQFADASLRRGWIEHKGMKVLNLFSDSSVMRTGRPRWTSLFTNLLILTMPMQGP